MRKSQFYTQKQSMGILENAEDQNQDEYSLATITDLFRGPVKQNFERKIAIIFLSA